MVDVSIIIVNWNTKKLLKECIESVYKETKKYSFEIIVVDNNSPDNSADMVREEFPDVTLIANTDNKGFAAGNNQALKIANGKNLFLLNPDTVVLEGAIDKMLDFIYDKKCGALTCKLQNTDGSLQKSVNSFYSFWASLFESRFFANISKKINFKTDKFMTYWAHDEVKKIDWARGAVLMFTKEVMDKIGVLDERYYIYGEEIDFYFRVRKAGFDAYFIPNAVILHHGKSSSKQRRAEMFIQNYKSLYIFLKKNYNSYSYYLYRLRVYIFLIIWIIKHSINSLIKKNSEESGIQLDVYKKTFIWHFKKESFI